MQTTPSSQFPLPSLPLYTAAQTRELDRLAIEQGNITGYCLMERAASCTFNHIMSRWPNCKKIIVICGTGNNGGDGYLIAKLALEKQISVEVYQLGDLAKQSVDAFTARETLLTRGVRLRIFEQKTVLKADVIVDALLGTGLERAVSGLWLMAIQAINLSCSAVVSVDIPSGLHADTGSQLNESVQASLTVTYIGRKQGLYTADGPLCAGEIQFDDLSIPAALYHPVPAKARLISNDLTIHPHSAHYYFPPRQKNSHKGTHGHVFVVGGAPGINGAPGMNGAVIMAATAALRSGCGLVTVVTHSDHASYINLNQPEIMSCAVGSKKTLKNIVSMIESTADVIVLGPGLGRLDWSQDLFQVLLETNKPMVLDADGLNLLAQNPCRKINWILTPHPGEAARLLNCSTFEIQRNRFKAVKLLQEKFGGVIVLKGAGTLIFDGSDTYVCGAGNPGMASAGMGDVLSGILGSLIGQQLRHKPFSLMETAAAGVFLHACAGDMAARLDGERGLLATDLMPYIRRLANGSVGT